MFGLFRVILDNRSIKSGYMLYVDIVDKVVTTFILKVQLIMYCAMSWQYLTRSVGSEFRPKYNFYNFFGRIVLTMSLDISVTLEHK